MAIIFEKQKAEAISRLKQLGISAKVIQDYEENGQLYMAIPPSGDLTPLKPEGLEALHRFEEKNHVVLYFAIRSAFPIASDAYLCVGPFEEDWETERAGITKHGEGVLAYVFNPADRTSRNLGSFRFNLLLMGELSGLAEGYPSSIHCKKEVPHG